jgi:hypothetical protein
VIVPFRFDLCGSENERRRESCTTKQTTTTTIGGPTAATCIAKLFVVLMVTVMDSFSFDVIQPRHRTCWNSPSSQLERFTRVRQPPLENRKCTTGVGELVDLGPSTPAIHDSVTQQLCTNEHIGTFENWTDGVLSYLCLRHSVDFSLPRSFIITTTGNETDRNS